MSPWTRVGPSILSVGQRRLELGQIGQVRGRPRGEARCGRLPGQLGPTAKQRLEVELAAVAQSGRPGLGRQHLVGLFEGAEDQREARALPTDASGVPRRSPRRPAPPTPRRRRCRATPGRPTTACSCSRRRHRLPRRCSTGDSTLSSAPTALTNTGGPAEGASRGCSRHPARTLPVHVAYFDGRTCSRVNAAHAPPHRYRAPAPRQVDAGRAGTVRAGRSRESAAAPAAANASVMLATRRRADSALSSTATRAWGSTGRVGEADVQRVVKGRMKRVINAHLPPEVTLIHP